MNALRFGFLANGGAAVALLAFFGQNALTETTAGAAKVSMALFIFGIILSGLAHATAYMTQLRLFQEMVELAKYDKPTHGGYLNATVWLSVLSVGMFGIGAWCGIGAISPSI